MQVWKRIVVISLLLTTPPPFFPLPLCSPSPPPSYPPLSFPSLHRLDETEAQFLHMAVLLFTAFLGIEAWKYQVHAVMFVEFQVEVCFIWDSTLLSYPMTHHMMSHDHLPYVCAPITLSLISI